MSVTFEDAEIVLGELRLSPGAVHVVRHPFREQTKLHGLRFPAKVARTLMVRECILNSAHHVPPTPFALEQAHILDLPVAEAGQEFVLHLHNPTETEVRFVLGADVTYLRG